ncbi:hypothetical protein [Peribacillus sp. SI8-4]|uniref:hypothetical protein n=1 Tax=Peribacillus sp. SI8-4 TaxID=3048009 RepID=UPI0025567192|nr:hypothetical protein [Peribacillus sp. SI8-4]
MEYQIPLKEDLESLAKTRGFSLVNGTIEIDRESENQIKIPNQKEFLDFHVHVENKLLFYNYLYAYEEDYLIPNEYNQGYEETIQERLNMEIHEYNKMIKEIDFQKPSLLLMYYIKEGFLFYNYTVWEHVFELSEYEEMVEIIVKKVVREIPEERLKEISEKTQAEKDKQKQELKELIFADSTFKTSTNLRFRKAYTARFFQSHPEYQEFLRHAGYSHPIFFIEEIWKEFKEKGLHK